MENLVSSICNLNTRKFGDVGEILMSKIVKGLEKSDDLSDFSAKNFSRSILNLEQ